MMTYDEMMAKLDSGIYKETDEYLETANGQLFVKDAETGLWWEE